MNPHLERAHLLFQQSRYETAEEELRQALAGSPDDPYAHSLLGLCLLQREQFAEATREAQQAVHLSPDLDFAHYALARIYYERRHFTEAMAAITETLRLNPADVDAHALQAQLYLEQQRWAEALAAAERGLQVDSEHVGCTNLRAIALVKLGRRAEAGATIDAALARRPDDAVTHANQGWTLLEQGDHRRALEHFREALRLDPTSEWAREGIIEALKARHFLYSLFLRYFFWMSKLRPGTQWAILIAGYFANRLLGTLATQNPELAPAVWPLRILYLGFVLLTWTADPLFNLLLRLNRFGRLVLSDEKRIASNWVGLCVFLTLAAVLVCFFTQFHPSASLAAIVCGIMIIPMAGTFKTVPGWPRRMMGVYTGLMAAAGVAVVAISVSAGDQPLSKTGPRNGLFMLCLNIFIIAAIGSSWVANWLAQQRPRR
ncbi:MAG TPA: tetratricopeptide repeat protein [Verrucomicrobiae bacterium]|nr:tetratricopeptide repeat protein [Verrucomicrobiae bacterium]